MSGRGPTTSESGASSLAPLPPSFYEGVRDRLRERARSHSLDGLLVLAPGNVRYATGWHFSVNERPTGLWLPVDGDPILLVPFLEREVAEDVPGVSVRTYAEYPGVTPPELWMLEEASATRIAIDALDATLLDQARATVSQLDLVDHVLPERSVKQESELALIREAAHFADCVLERLLERGGDIIGQGGTEADLLSDCTDHVRSLLASAHGEAFRGTKMGITASLHSGPRGALPHGSITARAPQPGEPVIAGIGCSIGGYHAESGVTIVVGDISEAQACIMRAMTDSAAATCRSLQEGVTCSEVNDAALDPIRRAGFASALRHRIGHGMGVEGHEAPWLAPGDETAVTGGMVFSCEPGIYRPGLDGWRTIDTLIVHDRHVELASNFLRRHPPESRVLPC